MLNDPGRPRSNLLFYFFSFLLIWKSFGILSLISVIPSDATHIVFFSWGKQVLWPFYNSWVVLFNSICVSMMAFCLNLYSTCCGKFMTFQPRHFLFLLLKPYPCFLWSAPTFGIVTLLCSKAAPYCSYNMWGSLPLKSVAYFILWNCYYFYKRQKLFFIEIQTGVKKLPTKKSSPYKENVWERCILLTNCPTVSVTLALSLQEKGVELILWRQQPASPGSTPGHSPAHCF